MYYGLIRTLGNVHPLALLLNTVSCNPSFRRRNLFISNKQLLLPSPPAVMASFAWYGTPKKPQLRLNRFTSYPGIPREYRDTGRQPAG